MRQNNLPNRFDFLLFILAVLLVLQLGVAAINEKALFCRRIILILNIYLNFERNIQETEEGAQRKGHKKVVRMGEKAPISTPVRVCVCVCYVERQEQ